MGDGGAIITNNYKIYNNCKIYANYGSLNFKDPNHKSIGINSRMDEIQAAFLIEKLKKFKKDTNERIKIAKKYNFYCDKLKINRIETRKDFKNVYHIYPILINNRNKIKKIRKTKYIHTNPLQNSNSSSNSLQILKISKKFIACY